MTWAAFLDYIGYKFTLNGRVYTFTPKSSSTAAVTVHGYGDSLQEAMLSAPWPWDIRSMRERVDKAECEKVCRL